MDKEDMIADIQETFKRLQKINMKLTPKKCSLGIEEGKFLDYVVSKQGIKANPAKIKALTSIKRPRTIKEMPRLNGKLAVLIRMISRWAMELEEHEIEFKPRNAIKAQILADFLAETQEEDDEIDFQNQKEKGKITRWKLYIDGASSSDATNNEAEYEAVIGLRIAKEMKIEEITVFVDSQLVANQVNRSYEAKHHHIKQYIQIAKELLKSFRRSEVQYIRRNQNKKADALSKLASLT
ncbi:reverse transcriptase domain-containing protein, partial [Tanacetum coccineum]